MKTVLLVDDDAQLRLIFRMGLTRNGYRVLEAESGSMALDLAKQHLPDLILSDINMPGGDGTTLLHDIRHDPELRSRQVVLMTGRPDLVTPRRGMEAGADDFLVKPVELQALLNCVNARFSRASVNWRVEDEQLAQLQSLVPPQLPHEVFTPLAGIIGLVEILRSDISSLTPTEIDEILNDVYFSGLRLHRTFRNYLLILDLQNITSGTPPTPLDPPKIRASIQAGIDEALRLNKRQEDVFVQAEECVISIKPEDLGRLVEELVDNAFKFSRHGSPVTVEVTAERRLIITDQGRGMASEAVSRIGAFQQFDRKKHEQQGLGLGLMLVQKLTGLYGAQFSINSEPGKGTRVEIAFPQAAGT
jgi:two-component system sensor histidine kinase/response regulator